MLGGDMMAQMNEMQQRMQQELAKLSLTGEAGDGAVTVQCNGLRQLTNISIDPSKVDPADSEALEDLLLVAANRALEKAAEQEAAQGSTMMQSMLPPGMAGLFGQ
ncbi:MAG: YbaB/EbfC family nucleoid-associated protein [Saprospiraceae bacterium]